MNKKIIIIIVLIGLVMFISNQDKKKGAAVSSLTSIEAHHPIPVSERQICRTDNGNIFIAWMDNQQAVISKSTDGNSWSRTNLASTGTTYKITIDCQGSKVIAFWNDNINGKIAYSSNYGASYGYTIISNAFLDYYKGQPTVWISGSITYFLSQNSATSATVHKSTDGGASISSSKTISIDDCTTGGSMFSTASTLRMVVVGNQVFLIGLNSAGDMVMWKSTDGGANFGSKTTLYTDPKIDIGDSFWCNGYSSNIFCTGSDYDMNSGSTADYCLYNLGSYASNPSPENCHTPTWSLDGCLDASNSIDISNGDIYIICDGRIGPSSSFTGKIYLAKWNGVWSEKELTGTYTSNDRYYMPHAARYTYAGSVDYVVSKQPEKYLLYGTGTVSTCGNDIKEGPESCDGTDLGGNNCVSIMGEGYTGTLACTSCTSWDTSGCSKYPQFIGFKNSYLSNGDFQSFITNANKWVI